MKIFTTNLFLFLCLFSSVEGKLKEYGGRNSTAECWERDHGLPWGGETLQKMMRFPMEVRASLYSTGQDNMADRRQAGSPNTDGGSRMGDQVQAVSEQPFDKVELRWQHWGVLRYPNLSGGPNTLPVR